MSQSNGIHRNLVLDQNNHMFVSWCFVIWCVKVSCFGFGKNLLELVFAWQRGQIIRYFFPNFIPPSLHSQCTVHIGNVLGVRLWIYFIRPTIKSPKPGWEEKFNCALRLQRTAMVPIHSRHEGPQESHPKPSDFHPKLLKYSEVQSLLLQPLAVLQIVSCTLSWVAIFRNYNLENKFYKLHNFERY